MLKVFIPSLVAGTLFLEHRRLSASEHEDGLWHLLQACTNACLWWLCADDRSTSGMGGGRDLQQYRTRRAHTTLSSTWGSIWAVMLGGWSIGLGCRGVGSGDGCNRRVKLHIQHRCTPTPSLTSPASPSRKRCELSAPVGRSPFAVDDRARGGGRHAFVTLRVPLLQTRSSMTAPRVLRSRRKCKL